MTITEKEEKTTGNGCYLNVCEFFVNGRCLRDDDFVSEIDGRPICYANPNSISYKEYKILKKARKYEEEHEEEIKTQKSLDALSKLFDKIHC
jgi:hypothetical protein